MQFYSFWKIVPRFSHYYRSDVFISLLRQFALLVTLAAFSVWACGVGGLPLRRYSLRVRADGSRVPSVIFYTSATSWRIERCRPARDASNAGVADAACKYWLFTCGADPVFCCLIGVFSLFSFDLRQKIAIFLAYLRYFHYLCSRFHADRLRTFLGYS